MPVFITLEVKDISAATRWYQEALGFRPVFDAPPGPDGKLTLVHLRRERYQDLLLVPTQMERTDPPREGLVINFLPGEESVSTIAERARAARSPEVDGPIERPWNAREITITDLDRYRIRFSEPIDMNKTFDEVIEGLGGA
jgi:catechol 2,3-dioxygenase-like lactoylglutathione lyase family enzyme